MKGTFPPNPNMTLDINNDELEAVLEEYIKAKDVATLNKLVALIHHARVLAPAKVDNNKPTACFIKNSEGKVFLPIYTSKKHISDKAGTTAILNLPYIAVNELGLREEVGCTGVVINPFTTNLIFKKELLVKIAEAEMKMKQAQAAGQGHGAPAAAPALDPEVEYALRQRRRFEMEFLPKKLFAEGEKVVQALCKDKEIYLDQLYEESYEDNLRYPYLDEELSVMPMNVSEELLVIRMDMPTRDMAVGMCHRVYVVWNTNEKTVRYFTLEQNVKNNMLCELTSAMEHLNYGEAPVEGSEIQKIMELLEA